MFLESGYSPREQGKTAGRAAKSIFLGSTRIPEKLACITFSESERREEGRVAKKLALTQDRTGDLLRASTEPEDVKETQ